MVLNERDITRNTNAVGDEIITSITLVLRVITKEDTGRGLSREFSALTRGNIYIAHASKNTKVVITWRATE